MSCGTYNTNSQVKFKTEMPKSIVWDYSDAYILVNITIPVTNTVTTAAPNNGEKIYFKIMLQDIDIVMLMGKIIEYSHNHSKVEVYGSTIWMNHL